MIRAVRRLVEMQTRHYVAILVAALVWTIAMSPLASQIRLDADFTAMLPEHKQSVEDIAYVRKEFGSRGTLVLAVRTTDDVFARKYVRDYAKRIAEANPKWIDRIDWNVEDFQRFLRRNRFLYASVDDLEELDTALADLVAEKKTSANPFFVSLDDNLASAQQNFEDVVSKLKKKASDKQAEFPDFPGGFYQGGGYTLMLIRTKSTGNDTAGNAEMRKLLRSLAPKYDAKPKDLRIVFGGDVMDVYEEQSALEEAAIVASILVVILVLGVIFLYFRSKRAIVILGLTLVPPVMTTFAIAYLWLEYLTASTAFLISIVIGNGINPMIIWLGRYFEFRRGGEEHVFAIEHTHQTTWRATVVASGAAAVAYASLMITSFRGFSDFGIIGFSGMVLCWVATYTLLPSLLTWAENFKPFLGKVRGHFNFGGPVFRLVMQRPGLISSASLLFSLVCAALVVLAGLGDPFEYDFRNLQSERDPDSQTSKTNKAMSRIVNESQTGSAIVTVVPSVDDVKLAAKQLTEYGKKHPKVIGAIRTIYDFIPAGDQEEKIELLDSIRQQIDDVEEHLDPKDAKAALENRPPDRLRVLTIEDIPESVAAMFRDEKGNLGRILFVEHDSSRSGWDGRFMMEWAKAARSVSLDKGDRVAVAGNAAVFADLVQAIWTDAPRALFVAFVSTLVIVFFAFRRFHRRMMTMAVLLVGVLWMAALMYAFGQKLNFLNLIAFPITFGNGVDYGVNVMKRYEIEREEGLSVVRSVQNAIEGSGGAVILCSLTTIIGYLTLYASSNKALNSFGAAMAISEVTCLVAAVITLPATLLLFERSRKKTAG